MQRMRYPAARSSDTRRLPTNVRIRCLLAVPAAWPTCRVRPRRGGEAEWPDSGVTRQGGELVFGCGLFLREACSELRNP